MRIAMLGLRGVPASFGGIEHHVEEIGAGLASRGHDVTVFCRTNYVESQLDEYRGMRLRHLPAVGTKHLDAIVHSAISTLAAGRRSFDVIHYHALGPGIVAPLARALSGAKVVQTIHGLDNQRAKWGAAARSVLSAGAWMSARVPDATVVVSRSLASHYEQHYGRNAVYIPNGVREPTVRPPDRIRARFGLTTGSYVLFVGRFVPEKAPDVLVRAFRHITGDMKLVLAGGSSFTDGYVESLHNQASADPRVILPGYVYGYELDELYSNAAAFVLPSALEGMPLTLLEAISYGTPVVASSIPPHLEVVVGDGAGHRLFPAGDEHALVDALRRVLTGEHERQGAAALRSRVLDAYRWDAAVSATECLYRELVGLTPALTPGFGEAAARSG